MEARKLSCYKKKGFAARRFIAFGGLNSAQISTLVLHALYNALRRAGSRPRFGRPGSPTSRAQLFARSYFQVETVLPPYDHKFSERTGCVHKT